MLAGDGTRGRSGAAGPPVLDKRLSRTGPSPYGLDAEVGAFPSGSRPGRKRIGVGGVLIFDTVEPWPIPIATPCSSNVGRSIGDGRREGFHHGLGTGHPRGATRFTLAECGGSGLLPGHRSRNLEELDVAAFCTVRAPRSRGSLSPRPARRVVDARGWLQGSQHPRRSLTARPRSRCGPCHPSGMLGPKPGPRQKGPCS
jgi:hypothetical protein